MTPLPTGAWNLWRDEMRAGVRTADDIDPLRNAAWCDACGLDALEDGLPRLAEMWFGEARILIHEMGEQERAA